ncbi:MAG: electron transfer flavoprotein subunit alpha/FixB family protein [Bacteroidetes bacterium]|nr:electron transfer flavoprotein subunit alpha/FixB family protein [Bacteroidota bacterium]
MEQEEDIERMKILAFAEQRNGKFKKAAFEVVSVAYTLAQQTGGEVIALVIGDSIDGIASELGEYGAHRVLVVQDPKLALYSPIAYARIIVEMAARENATVVLLSATALGKDCAPRVAVKLNAGLAADCIAVDIQDGDIRATRPMYGGKVLADVKITTPVKVLTIRPNVFAVQSIDGTRPQCDVVSVSLQDADFTARTTAVTIGSGKLDVAEADIVITGGRGLKGPENFKMLEDLAEVLGGAVGASRAAVDAGWRPHGDQVGQTGKTVSPTLYIAVGVSGSIQHVAGMSSSKYIVAINKDKDAPIFQIADYGIVGDAFEIVPALTQEVKKLLGK